MTANDQLQIETALSFIDGQAGRLILRGRPLDQVAGVLTFEEAAAYMWQAPLADLGPARVWAWRHLDRSRCMRDGMDELRRAIAGLQDATPVQLVAAMSVATAVWIRSRADRPPVAPDPSLDHVSDLLRMIHGAPPSAAEHHSLSTYLCTVMEHGMNASTFAARVVASTRSDDVSAVVAAIGALKGPLHGGAPGPVLHMLDAIQAHGDAELWLRGELAAGRRIMGMGHRVYRVRDPRAAVLEGAVHGLVSSSRLQLARAVERTAERLLAEHRPGRDLRANVEFYTAILLEALHIPPEAFTAMFATARVVGWLAHTEEQRRTGRLIRPRATYVG